MFKNYLWLFLLLFGLTIISGCGSDGGSSADFKTASVSVNMSNPSVADMIEAETWEDTDSNPATPDILTGYSLGSPVSVAANFTIGSNTAVSSTVSAFQVESVTVNYTCKSSTPCPAIGPYTYNLGSSSATGSTTISPTPSVLVMPAEFISANQAFYLAGNISQWEVTLLFRVKELSTNTAKTLSSSIILNAYNEAN